MSTPHVKYLLVGGGVAASSAADAIRRIDRAGSIMLVGQEITRPYHRPPLSKQFLRHEVSRDALFTAPAESYAERQIELITGQRVSAIDAARRMVSLDSGKEICFDRLLLAIGATPIPLDLPGAALPNVFYLRSLEDADRLHASIEKAKHEGRLHPPGHGLPRHTSTGRGRAILIGGGLLGVELSASLSQMGLAVDLIVATETPWSHCVGEAAGKFLTRYLEHQGVTVHLSTTAVRIEGDGRVQRVVLSDGTIVDADLVIGAIGVAVNRQILRGTSIRAEKAILTDESCRTNIDSVYAAGDCAAVFDPATGKHRIGQHWTTAQLTGRIAGENMAGGHAVYDAVPQFSSRVFDLPIRVFGESRHIHRRLLRGTPNVEHPSFLEIGITANNQIGQIVAVGEGHDLEKLEAMVKDRLVINGNEEQLKDPASPI